MKPYEKLKLLRINKNITTYELSELTGIPQSTISKMENGKRRIETDSIVLLAKALEISISVFFEDEENKNSDIIDLKELNKINIDAEFITIPIVGSIRAGHPILAEDNLQGYIPVMRGNLKTDSTYFGLKVKGDSMNLEFEEGTILVVEKTPCIENGEIGVIRIDGLEATVKKVVLSNEMITLIPISSNPEHIPHMYNLKIDDIEIIGRVKQAIKTY